MSGRRLYRALVFLLLLAGLLLPATPLQAWPAVAQARAAVAEPGRFVSSLWQRLAGLWGGTAPAGAKSTAGGPGENGNMIDPDGANIQGAGEGENGMIVDPNG